MAVGWYIIPYKRRVGSLLLARYCEMDDYTADLAAVGGYWAEVEILGDRAIVKVSAPPAALTQLNGVAGFKRLPKDTLTAPLSDLSAAAKQALKDEALDQGYSLAEINAKFPGDLGDYTLKDVLKFMATRRLKPRYDSDLDEIILDGPIQSPESIDNLDAKII